MIAVVPTAFLGIILVTYLRIKRPSWRDPGLIILVLYLGSSFLAASFPPEGYRELLARNDCHPTTVGFAYGALLTVAILPVFFIRRPDAKKLAGHPFARLLAYFSCPMIVFAFLYLVPFAWRSGRLGADTVRVMLQTEATLPSSIWTTLAVAVATFYMVFALLFFVGKVGKMSFAVQATLFVGATLAVVWGVAFAARDGMLYFLLMLLFGEWAFAQRLADGRLARALLNSAVLAITVYLFALFTFQRFGGHGGGEVGRSIVDYYGTQPFVFAERVSSGVTYGWSLRFPLIAEFLGNYTSIVRTQPFEWQFGTFLADFYAVGGWVTACGFTLLLSICSSVVFALKKHLDELSYTLILGLYVQFMFQGVFYFRLGNFSGNVYLLAVLFLSGLAPLVRRVAHEWNSRMRSGRRHRRSHVSGLPPLQR